MTSVPHDLIDGVCSSIRNVDSNPTVTSVETARQLISRAVGCPREPHRTVPFDGLADRRAAKHGSTETRPVKAAQTVSDGISAASHGHKHLTRSAPTNSIANSCYDGIAATIPVGSVITICDCMARVRAARYINIPVVLNVINRRERNISRSVVPVNAVVTEC